VYRTDVASPTKMHNQRQKAGDNVQDCRWCHVPYRGDI